MRITHIIDYLSLNWAFLRKKGHLFFPNWVKCFPVSKRKLFLDLRSTKKINGKLSTIWLICLLNYWRCYTFFFFLQNGPVMMLLASFQKGHVIMSPASQLANKKSTQKSKSDISNGNNKYMWTFWKILKAILI